VKLSILLQSKESAAVCFEYGRKEKCAGLLKVAVFRDLTLCS
jgi:hypothetical protein